jgi:hypothetical protein
VEGVLTGPCTGGHDGTVAPNRTALRQRTIQQARVADLHGAVDAAAPVEADQVAPSELPRGPTPGRSPHGRRITIRDATKAVN